MWNFIENILSNIVATAVVAVGSVLVASLTKWLKLNIVATAVIIFGSVLALSTIWFKPDIFPIAIVTIVIFFCFVVFYTTRTFGMAKFKWGYFISLEKRTMFLGETKNGTDYEQVCTVKNKFLRKDITIKVNSNYDWNDINVKCIEPTFTNVSNKKFTASCEKALVNNHVKEETQKIEKEISGRTEIPNGYYAKKAEFEVSFRDNKPADVTVKADFDYDPTKMQPEYFIQVVRPMKKMVLELEVQKGVPLHNVHMEISAYYGDVKDEKNKRLSEKKKKKKGEKTVTVYRYVKRNPHLLHKYAIKWDWCENIDA